MPRGVISSVLKCCGCNGPNAVCKSCRCRKANRPCDNCAASKCSNRLSNKIQVEDNSSEMIRQPNIIQNQDSKISVNSDIFNDSNVTETRSDLSIKSLYYQVIHWIPNHFSLPNCNVSKTFIDILSECYERFVSLSYAESCPLEEATVLSQLVLQRIPSRKTNVIRKTLEKRILLWKQGKRSQLLSEALYAQNMRKKSFEMQNVDDTLRVKRVINLVKNGKLSKAKRMLFDQKDHGIMSTEQTIGEVNVLTILKELHPEARRSDKKYIMAKKATGCVDHHDIRMLELSSIDIVNAARKTSGSAGPSGVDAGGWRNFLTAHGKSSEKLASIICEFAIKISTELVEPSSLKAYTTCRLVPLNKRPGVRPVGIGEVLRRIVGRALLRHIGDDIQSVCRNVQLCGGQRGGTEAAVHMVRRAFNSSTGMCAIFLDAKNAFNCLNRELALKNVIYTCPSLHKILTNTYSEPAELTVEGHIILSAEGFTQGDPLSMPSYAVAMMPLIERLQNVAPDACHKWYADDGVCVGNIVDIESVWSEINKIGKSFGYYVNPSKCVLLTHNINDSVTDSMVLKSGVQAKLGVKYLGSYIGHSDYITCECKAKIENWQQNLDQLKGIISKDAFASYIMLNKALQHEQRYVKRTVETKSEWFESLRDKLFDDILPHMLGYNNNLEETKKIISLPNRYGGLGIWNPCEMNLVDYQNSLQLSQPLMNGEMGFELARQQNEIQIKQCNERKTKIDELRNELIVHSSQNLSLILENASAMGASSFLTPSYENRSVFLTTREFHDALSIRYNWKRAGTVKCYCGQGYGLEHVLSCKREGKTFIRHNMVRDTIANVLKRVCREVYIEPVLENVPETIKLTGQTTTNRNARSDIYCSGLFGDMTCRSFMDICVYNHLAPSYSTGRNEHPQLYHEARKRSKYEERITEIEHGIFYPLVIGVTGAMGPTINTVVRQIARKLSERQNQTYAQSVHDIRYLIATKLAKANSFTMRLKKYSEEEQDTITDD